MGDKHTQQLNIQWVRTHVKSKHLNGRDMMAYRMYVSTNADKLALCCPLNLSVNTRLEIFSVDCFCDVALAPAVRQANSLGYNDDV